MIDRSDIPENDAVKRLFCYLRYNSYRSERYRLFYVATPKVACTTLKWWFAELEGCDQAIREATDSKESDPDLVIHDTFHRVAPHVTGLSPVPLKELLASDSYFRFALVSNPYKRIFSAWQSKLLLMEPLQTGPYLNCDFFHHPFECKEDIASAFEAFLVHLDQNESPDFLDFHWTPQASLLQPDLVSYSMLSKIEDTRKLSRELVLRTGRDIPDPFKGPRLNESLIPFCTGFLTDKSSGLIRSLYAMDFEIFGYDDKPPLTNQPFTDEQFGIVRKAVMLIRGRHKQLSERYGLITELTRQAAKQEMTIREKDVYEQQKAEELRITNYELRIKKEELDSRTDELGQTAAELKKKEEELRITDYGLRITKEALEKRTEELRQAEEQLKKKEEELRITDYRLQITKEELDQRTEELRQTKGELEKREEELGITDYELRITDYELRITKEGLDRITKELSQTTEELKKRDEELRIKDYDLRIKDYDLRIKDYELRIKDEELKQRAEQLNQVLTSKTWLLTKPVRTVLDKVLKFFQKTGYIINTTSAIIKNNGGLKKSVLKTFNVIMNEGLGRLPVHCRIQIQLAGKTARSYESPTEDNTTRSAEIIQGLTGAGIDKNVSTYKGSVSVLFIGHDARLAGAQVLLLSLVKWLRQHTGIGIKIILLQDGVLLDKFRDMASTIIWEDLLKTFPGKEERKSMLSDFTGKVDLIYGNTVLSPAIYDELAFLDAPFITHVHELEKSIKLYAEKSVIDKMLLYTGGYIACSEPVAMNLNLTHRIPNDKIMTIHEFIEDRLLDLTIDKKVLRKKAGLNEKGITVICCGTFYWRKGGDLFIETAIRLKQQGFTDFHFWWIGENIWDTDIASFRLSSWKKLEQRIQENDLTGHITFTGVRENVFDYLQACDLFYLPSREDPFPLVCLEAAQCGLPVICFEDAGGMPGFVEKDAGFVIPFEDIDAAADKILYLYHHPDVSKELGANARKKFLKRHTINSSAPDILQYCRKVGKFQPAVSIIIPNYNCEKFLVKRMESIFDQTFRDFEVIILDDASTDRSFEILEKYSHSPGVRLIKNDTNSGSPFLQWQKGVAEAKGAIIWLAEADDFCEPDFLQKLLPYFNDVSVALTYSDSAIIDEHDVITGDYSGYYSSLDPNHWQSSYQVTGAQEINWGLGIKNSIPNASAVLIRKSSIPESFFESSPRFTFCGDWLLYVRVIKGRQVAFHARKLNYHRKHQHTVTSAFNTEKTSLLLRETEIMHDHILMNYTVHEDFMQKWEFYVAEQICAFYPNAETEDFDHFYPYTSIRKKIEDAIIKGKNSRKLCFITTNDGTPDGGSEQLWIKTAIECNSRGHEVMVVIKKWDPEPWFINDFQNAGITVIFKEHDHFDQIRQFRPDLMIISLGDQDEGIEYFEKCKQNRIPYVIVNQLTKEPKYWPVISAINDQVREGYLDSEIVLFTGKNNREVMERRLGCKIPRAGIIFNPFDVDRSTEIPFPSMEKGLKIAMVGNLLRIHKGQHLALELFHRKKWRDRQVHLNIYGKGNDEEILKKQAADHKMKNVTFHSHSSNILEVWKENHAILMPSFMEGLPLALVGALICGRVAIVTDIGSHREVIEDNITGFIASEPTVEALDEALERAFQRSAEWEAIGQNARKAILRILPEDPVDHFIKKILTLQ